MCYYMAIGPLILTHSSGVRVFYEREFDALLFGLCPIRSCAGGPICRESLIFHRSMPCALARSRPAITRWPPYQSHLPVRHTIFKIQTNSRHTWSETPAGLDSCCRIFRRSDKTVNGSRWLSWAKRLHGIRCMFAGSFGNVVTGCEIIDN